MNTQNPIKKLEPILKQILICQKNGIYPKNEIIRNGFDLVFHFSEIGDTECEVMYNFHSKFIKDLIKLSITDLESVPKEGYINFLYEEINRIEYMIYVFKRIFEYLERFYIKAKAKTTLIKSSFGLYKDNFFNPLKNDIFHALTNYFKEIDKIHKEENVKKIKKIFKLMFYNDKIINPKIVKKSNNEFIWENEEIELDESINHIPTDTFGEWFNNYFLPYINPLVVTKYKEIKDLPINEYIPFILHFEYPIFQKYFDTIHYNKILSVFIENFIKENNDKIEEYFFNLNRNELKKVYEENKTSKRCVN